MFTPSANPRILFVTSEVILIPYGIKNQIRYVVNHNGGFSDYLSDIIIDLCCMGSDVHVVQPDYRQIFTTTSPEAIDKKTKTIPAERVHLAEDRVFYYSKYPESNSKWENIKISIAFQREVINRVIPEVQPDLIHCHDWMTGLVPAMAKTFEIPCLYTVQNPDTAKSSLSYVEDMGIDAAVFWQHLFYDRYPISYEEIRESNPANFLLSGILAANFVTTSSSAFLAKIDRQQSLSAELPFWKVLAKKKNAGCATINRNFAISEQYLEIYQKLLKRSLFQSDTESFEFNAIVH